MFCDYCSLPLGLIFNFPQKQSKFSLWKWLVWNDRWLLFVSIKIQVAVVRFFNAIISIWFLMYSDREKCYSNGTMWCIGTEIQTIFIFDRTRKFCLHVACLVYHTYFSTYWTVIEMLLIACHFLFSIIHVFIFCFRITQTIVMRSRSGFPYIIWRRFKPRHTHTHNKHRRKAFFEANIKIWKKIYWNLLPHSNRVRTAFKRWSSANNDEKKK